MPSVAVNAAATLSVLLAVLHAVAFGAAPAGADQATHHAVVRTR